jgi:hypothetical protein
MGVKQQGEAGRLPTQWRRQGTASYFVLHFSSFLSYFSVSFLLSFICFPWSHFSVLLAESVCCT